MRRSNSVSSLSAEVEASRVQGCRAATRLVVFSSVSQASKMSTTNGAGPSNTQEAGTGGRVTAIQLDQGTLDKIIAGVTAQLRSQPPANLRDSENSNTEDPPPRGKLV